MASRQPNAGKHPRTPKAFHGQVGKPPNLVPHKQGPTVPNTNPSPAPGTASNVPPLGQMGRQRPMPPGGFSGF